MAPLGGEVNRSASSRRRGDEAVSDQDVIPGGMPSRSQNGYLLSAEPGLALPSVQSADPTSISHHKLDMREVETECWVE